MPCAPSPEWAGLVAVQKRDGEEGAGEEGVGSGLPEARTAADSPKEVLGGGVCF